MSISTFFAEDIWSPPSTHGKLNVRGSGHKDVMESNNLKDVPIDVQIRADRKDLIGSLVRQYSDYLFMIILRMVQSHSTAEDILQETWVLVVRKFHQYDSSRPVKSWLARIAVNCCRSFWRRERFRSLLLPGRLSEKTGSYEPSEDPGVQRDLEARTLTSRALKSLSPKLCEVVVLKFYSGLTLSEIAEILKIPVGTAKSRLNRSLKKMREYFDRGERR